MGETIGGFGGRGDDHIGHIVGKCGVFVMADAGDDKCFGLDDGAGDVDIIENGQVLGAAAAAQDGDDVNFGVLVEFLDGVDNGWRGAFAFQHDILPFYGGQHGAFAGALIGVFKIADGAAAAAGDNADASDGGWRRFSMRRIQSLALEDVDGRAGINGAVDQPRVGDMNLRPCPLFINLDIAVDFDVQAVPQFKGEVTAPLFAQHAADALFVIDNIKIDVSQIRPVVTLSFAARPEEILVHLGFDDISNRPIDLGDASLISLCGISHQAPALFLR